MPAERFFARTLASSLLTLAAAAAAQTPQPHPAVTTRPNILVIALDDVGFSDLGCFGSEIRTPAIDSLAARGLRFTDFQSKAMCSPTRASIMTGRNPSTVGMEDLPTARKDSNPLPKLTGVIPSNAEMLPETLHRAGYTTIALGKWHLTPGYQNGDPGNNSTMPLQRGFDYFYGYKLGWTDQYHPDLYEGNTHLPDPYHPGYLLAEDLTDHAIAQLKKSNAEHPGKPTFTYLAYSFAHTPIQVPQSWIDRYKGQYDQGWDVLRQQRFAREKSMGLIPGNTVLPPRENGDPPWSSLTPTQQRVYAHFMEVYAAYISYGDAQIARLLDYMHTSGLDKNTVIVLFSDNGPASESKTGSFFKAYSSNTTVDEMAAHLSELGSPTTQPLYQRPWAYAGATPFRRYKLWPYFGGTRTPMIMDVPPAATTVATVPDPGTIRPQLVDATDIAPTLLALIGTSFSVTLNGIPQIPVAGTSITAILASPSAPPTRTIQFFNMRGNRAIISGDFRAVAMHKLGTSFDKDPWQLFNIKLDPTESTDLSHQNPTKLKELQTLWLQQAKQYGALPLSEMPLEREYDDAFKD